MPCAHTSGSVGRAQNAFVGPMASASAGVPSSCAGVRGARFGADDDATFGFGGDRSARISADISMNVTNSDPPRSIARFWIVAAVGKRESRGRAESQGRRSGAGRHVVGLRFQEDRSTLPHLG